MAGMVAGGFMAAAIAVPLGFDLEDRIKHQAIERGYALYCPTTGAYAWKGECDDR